MATFGARFRSPMGFVQIDQNYVNHALRQKGVLTINNNFGYLDVLAESPMLAFRCAAPTAIVRITPIDNGYKRYYFYVGAAGAQNVEWFLFDRARNGQTFNTPFGMIVRKPGTGEKVFDSRNKYLRVTSTDSRNWDNGDFRMSQPAGRAAIIQGCPCTRFWVEITNPGPKPDLMLFWLTSAANLEGDNTMHLQKMVWQTAGPYQDASTDYGPTYERKYSCYMLVDVTGY